MYTDCLECGCHESTDTLEALANELSWLDNGPIHEDEFPIPHRECPVHAKCNRALKKHILPLPFANHASVENDAYP